MTQRVDKASLPLDKPRRTPGHPTKSHIVKTKVDGKERIIRFGEQGAETAGKPKAGESDRMKQKRASFKARHAANIAKGKSSPAYWANKVKWAEGGAVKMAAGGSAALALIEQMRRAGGQTPEFDAVLASTREQRARPVRRPPAPPQAVQASQPREEPLPLPPIPPAMRPDENPPPEAPRNPMRFDEGNPYVATAIRMAEKYGIPTNIFLSLVQQESGFNPRAVSSRGAQGLGQLMPATARELGVTDPFNAEQNLEASARYLRQMRDRFGTMELALAAYNAGPGRVREAGNTIPNIRETQQYVPSILRRAGASTGPNYAEGGLADLDRKYADAAKFASKGRNGDTLVAHITPEEAKVLKAMGGSGTINPSTGFLEFYDSDGSGNASDSGNPTGGDNGGGGGGGGGSSDAATAVSDAIGAGFGPESSGYGNQGGPGPNASAGMSSADPEGTSQAANMSTATAAQQAGLGVGIADTGGVNPTGFAAAPGLAEVAAAYGLGNISLGQALGFGLQSAFSPPGVQIGTLTDNLGLQSQAASINPVGLGAGLAGLAAGLATGVPGLGLAAGFAGSRLGEALGIAPSIVSYTPGEGPTSNVDAGGGESDPTPPGVGFNLPDQNASTKPGTFGPSAFANAAPAIANILNNAIANPAASTAPAAAAAFNPYSSYTPLANLARAVSEAQPVRAPAQNINPNLTYGRLSYGLPYYFPQTISGFAKGGLAELDQKYAEGGPARAYDPDAVDALVRSIEQPEGYAEGGRVRRTLRDQLRDIEAEIRGERPSSLGVTVARGMGEGGGGIAGTVSRVGRAAQALPESSAASDILTYHGSPHTFAAERLIRRPGGSTEYLVGAPNRLPDVPEGADVVRDFPLGRFREDRIGTGEGAQTYGRGSAYLAEAEPVAETYLQGAKWSYGGRPADEIYERAYDRVSRPRARPEDNAAAYLWEQIALNKSPRSVIDDAIRNADDWPELAAYARTLRPEDFSRVGGNMYEVRLSADPSRMLDWDAPLSAQSRAIQEIARDVDTSNAFSKTRKMLDLYRRGEEQPHNLATGALLYRTLSNYNDDAARATSILRDAGVPGIRYLDQGSRGVGEGTRNYVVFDENMMEILRRYGLLPGAVGAGAALAAGEAEPEGYAEGGEVMSDEEYDRRLLSRMKAQTGRTTEPTRAEQMEVLRTAGRSAAEGVADVLMPQSPLDLALMAAFGPGGRAARLAGSAALASMEPSEAEASRFRRLVRAYHGSPHKFDEFDIRKVGTGEGAQAYGRGLYFAENEDIARSYRDKLSPLGTQAARSDAGPEGLVARLFDEGLTPQQALEEIDFRRGLPHIREGLERGDQGTLEFVAKLDRARELALNPSARGHMYEVDLNADPREFLNWDAPLSRQSPEVRESLERFNVRVDPEAVEEYQRLLRAGNIYGPKPRLPEFSPDPTGQEIYQRVLRMDPEEARVALMQAGIPGTRYFDAGSRGVGGGTSNYAVFDPEIIDIRRRYAEGGMIELENKYAEGGIVNAEAAKYDPDAVDALVKQIEAEYV